MRLSVFSGLIALVLVFASCDQLDFNKDINTADDIALIESIQAASKQVIDASNLPSTSLSVLSEDYAESYTELAQIAEGLGYEVKVRRGIGSQIGAFAAVYFDTDGRELSSKRDRGGRCCGKGKDRKECFDFVFPLTLVLPDGTTVTGDDKETLREEVKAWYEANPDVEDRPTLQFPVEIVMMDSLDTPVVTIINSEEELAAAYEACPQEEGSCEGGGKGRKKCFELVYPVTITMPDGTTLTGDDRQALRQEVKAWYEANPDSEEKPELVFPVDIVYKDETTATINSQEELEAAKEACSDDD